MIATDAKPPDALPLRALPAGCARSRATLQSTALGPSSCRSCMHRCHASSRSARLWSLRSLTLGFVFKLSLTTWSPLCNNSGLSRFALARPRSSTSFSWLLNRIASLRPIRPLVLTVFRRRFCRVIIILLMAGDFPPAPSLRTLWRTGNNTLSFFASLFGYRTAFRSRHLFSELLNLLRASPTLALALRASTGASQGRF